MELDVFFIGNHMNCRFVEFSATWMGLNVIVFYPFNIAERNCFILMNKALTASGTKLKPHVEALLLIITCHRLTKLGDIRRDVFPPYWQVNS